MQVIDNECTNCECQYRLGDDKKCSKTLNCSEIENGEYIKCNDDYYLGLDGICTTFEHFICSKDYECIECEENYYYNQLEKNAWNPKEFMKVVKYQLFMEPYVQNVEKVIILI